MPSSDKNKPVVRLVPAEMISLVWHQVLPLMLKNEKVYREHYQVEHIKILLEHGHMQLWITKQEESVKLAMITQFDVYPECIQLRYVMMFGSGFKDVMYTMKQVEEWAMIHGATKICIIGRDGWQKLLGKHGYHKKSVMLVKKLPVLKTEVGMVVRAN